MTMVFVFIDSKNTLELQVLQRYQAPFKNHAPNYFGFGLKGVGLDIVRLVKPSYENCPTKQSELKANPS